jgi:hypothetical protein
MNAHRLHSLIAVVVLLCFLMVAWSVPAEAQKKQKSKTPAKEQVKETPKDQPKEEQKEEAQETVSAPAPVPGSLPNKFLDVLKQYVGKQTNLGTLKKFAGDYIIFEDELTQILVPMTSIQSAKLVKEEEDSTAQLEIKLISRD